MSCCLSISPADLNQKPARLSAGVYRRPPSHTHTCAREVLESNLPIIQLHSAAMAPSRSCLFGFAAEKRNRISLFKRS